MYSPLEVDRIWGSFGSYYSIPEAILFYLLEGDYMLRAQGLLLSKFGSFWVAVRMPKPGVLKKGPPV